MVLVSIWISFIIIVGISKSNNVKLFYLSLFMLYLTYLYNVKIPTKLALKQATLLTVPPTILLWYVLYKCNDFLVVSPYNKEVFTGVFLMYTYIIVYILSENN